MANTTENINYKITVDAQTGTAVVRDLKGQIVATKVPVKELTNEFGNLSKAVNATRFNKFNAGLKTASKSNKNLGDASGAATSSVMELSRVISDAPYGIRGMANNITQLVSQMGFAAKKAGGFGGALKEMGKQLMGPLGIVFLITAAVSAFDYFYGTATKAEKSLNSVAESAAKSASALKILVKANDSGTMSMDQTVKAVKKANLEYKDLNIQVGKNGKITDDSVLAINRKIKSLENLAKATAIQSLIEQEFVKMDPLEKKLKKQEEEALVKLKVKGINTIKKAQDIADNSKDYALKGYTNGVITQVNSTKDEIDSIQKNIDRLIGKIPNIDDLFKGKAERKPKPKKKKLKVADVVSGLQELEGGEPVLIPVAFNPITPEYDEIAEFIEHYKTLMSGLTDFIDGEFERELTIEQNKTNALNAELNNRLNNENLSKDQRASIQNQIAQNDEKLRVKQEAIARKQFKVTKAFNIAMTIADTYMAAQKAYLSQMLIASPTAPIRAKIAAGIAVASGLAKVAAISRTTFQSTAPSTPTNIGGGGSLSGGGRSESSFNIVGGRTKEDALLGAIQAQFDQPLKAYVVSGDVTSQQELDRVIVSSSSL
jgi:hypothetical protein